MKYYFLFLIFVLAPLWGYETEVQSDQAYYNEEQITLMGHVTVENALGKVCASLAILKRDEEKRTKIDFPWIDLKEDVTLYLSRGGMLYCDRVHVDYIQSTSFFWGKPQVIYQESMGEVYADTAKIDYQELNGGLEATKITLMDHVKLANHGSDQNPLSQYALADEVIIYPQEGVMILEGKNNPVLFYDQHRGMQLSAYTVRAERNQETGKESVQGFGNVRFVFGPEELEKIKKGFQLQ